MDLKYGQAQMTTKVVRADRLFVTEFTTWRRDFVHGVIDYTGVAPSVKPGDKITITIEIGKEE